MLITIPTVLKYREDTEVLVNQWKRELLNTILPNPVASGINLLRQLLYQIANANFESHNYRYG